MKRRILIIGSALSGRDFLVGVRDDVQNFYRYVTSSIGGAYTNSEITYLSNPRFVDVQRVLNSCNQSEILTVYFSGHGYRHLGTDFICLNGTDVMAVTSLLTLAKRHVIITDACRTPIDTREYGDVISGIGFHFSNEYAELSRKLYWGYLSQAPVGDIFIYSTSENMPSTDTESGGIYTRSLMTALHNWSNTKNEKTISAHQVFQRSLALTRKYEPLQLPKMQYNKTVDVIHIPLGINPKAHLKTARSYSPFVSTAYRRF